MKMDKRLLLPAKLTFQSEGKDRLFKRINKGNEKWEFALIEFEIQTRKKGEKKLSRAFFFFLEQTS